MYRYFKYISMSQGLLVPSLGLIFEFLMSISVQSGNQQQRLCSYALITGIRFILKREY